MKFMTEHSAYMAFNETESGMALNEYHTKMQAAMRETDEAIWNYEKEHHEDAPEYMYACHNLATSAEMAAKAMYVAAFGTWLKAAGHEIADIF